MEKFLKISFISSFIFLAFLPAAHAYNLGDAFLVDDTHVCAGEYRDSLDCVADRANYQAVNEATPETIISNIITGFLSVLGVVFMVFMVYAGVLWLTAGGDEKKVDKAKNIIKQSIIGIIIVVAAYAISYFVLSSLMSSTGKIGPTG